MLGQAVDLLDVKHRVALHERDFALDFVAIVAGLGLVDAVGIDDERAVLALAHLAAELLACL